MLKCCPEFLSARRLGCAFWRTIVPQGPFGEWLLLKLQGALSLWSQHFHQLIDIEPYFVFLFRETLFNKYCWFINIELTANSTITYAWAKLMTMPGSKISNAPENDSFADLHTGLGKSAFAVGVCKTQSLVLFISDCVIFHSNSWKPYAPPHMCGMKEGK